MCPWKLTKGEVLNAQNPGNVTELERDEINLRLDERLAREYGKTWSMLK
jgi:hypothetical protein